jgi:hypothetical protein
MTTMNTRWRERRLSPTVSAREAAQAAKVFGCFFKKEPLASCP